MYWYTKTQAAAHQLRNNVLKVNHFQSSVGLCEAFAEITFRTDNAERYNI
jgi:hypothetical protein